MAQGNVVDDDELMYRNVQLRKDNFAIDGTGMLRISSAAFGDRDCRTSLFRHNLCDFPPHSNPPRLQPDSAVAKLTAHQIRERAGFTRQQEGQYYVDVIADTEDGQHKSHAIVVTNPLIAKSNRGAFDKLKERLARIFNESKDWAIAPPDSFVSILRNPEQGQ